MSHVDAIGLFFGEGAMIAVATFFIRKALKTEEGVLVAKVVDQIDRFIETAKEPQQ